MNSKWLKDAKTDTERTARKQQLKTFNPAFKELRLLVEDKKVLPKKEDYSNAAWAYLRADLDGYNRALDQVLDLLKEIK